eukprot:4711703-Pleurochrysis_carterae.AAC.1
MRAPAAQRSCLRVSDTSTREPVSGVQSLDAVTSRVIVITPRAPCNDTHRPPTVVPSSPLD